MHVIIIQPGGTIDYKVPQILILGLVLIKKTKYINLLEYKGKALALSFIFTHINKKQFIILSWSEEIDLLQKSIFFLTLTEIPCKSRMTDTLNPMGWIWYHTICIL